MTNKNHKPASTSEVLKGGVLVNSKPLSKTTKDKKSSVEKNKK